MTGVDWDATKFRTSGEGVGTMLSEESSCKCSAPIQVPHMEVPILPTFITSHMIENPHNPMHGNY